METFINFVLPTALVTILIAGMVWVFVLIKGAMKLRKEAMQHLESAITLRKEVEQSLAKAKKISKESVDILSETREVSLVRQAKASMLSLEEARRKKREDYIKSKK